jgi:hypothetical protein
MALAHVDRDDVRSAYNSALYLSPRRRMLQEWADHTSKMLKEGRELVSSEISISRAATGVAER